MREDTWICECCGARSGGVARLLHDAGEPLALLWICNRCSEMPLVHQMAGTIHFLREGHPAPKLLDRLERDKERKRVKPSDPEFVQRIVVSTH